MGKNLLIREELLEDPDMFKDYDYREVKVVFQF